MQIDANELWRHRSRDGSRPIRSVDTITPWRPLVVKLFSTNQKVLLIWAIIGDFTCRPLAAISARPIRTLHFKFQPIRMKQIAPQNVMCQKDILLSMFSEMNLHRSMRNASLSVDEASEILKSSTLTFVILLSLILTNKSNKFEQ